MDPDVCVKIFGPPEQPTHKLVIVSPVLDLCGFYPDIRPSKLKARSVQQKSGQALHDETAS